ncbi:MAG: tetratricopeptide repeat protein [Rhodoferax sp.]
MAIGRSKRKFQEVLKDARLGIAQAQYDVGLMYANGLGVPKNLSQALYWIRNGADRGHAGAQYLLGSHYASGHGLEKSAIHALYWLQKAAAQGHAKAHYKISLLFHEQSQALVDAYALQAWEMGVLESAVSASAAAPDEGRSQAILEQAAESGNARAHYGLAQGQHGADAGLRADVMRHLRAAARKNYPPAIVALRDMDQPGLGRSSDALAGRDGPDMRVVLQEAVALLEPSDVYARYCLGRMYEEGIKVAPNRQQAIAHYRSAAAAGDPQAQWALARIGAQGADASFDLVCQAAKGGCAPAQWRLGELLRERAADGGEQAHALSWLLQAACNGAAADWALLTDCLHGAGGAAISHQWLVDAAKGGEAQAQYLLGMRLLKGHPDPADADHGAAQVWLELASHQGHVRAQCELAHLLLAQPADGAAQALRWYQAAAQGGDAVAQWNVSKLLLAHAAGSDGDAQLRQAYLWCRRSAEQGFVPAQASLGTMYVRMGKPADALAWLTRAAEAGDAEAQYNLSVLLGASSEAADHARALDSLLAASHQGLFPAQTRLAWMYFEGKGLPRDPVEAMTWLDIAARHDSAAVAAAVAMVERILTPGQRQEAARRSRHWSARPGPAANEAGHIA